MPSLYTHYRFGQKIRPRLPDRLSAVIGAAEGPFNLGLQGPDFYFYGSVFRDNKAVRFGSALHDLPLRQTLERILAGFHFERGKPAGGLSDEALAYLLGFVGHFSLDASCHPYIYKIQETDANHLALETDFDNYWLRLDGLVPHKVKLYRFCCPADRRTVDTAALAFSDYQKEMDPSRTRQSVGDLRRVRRLMRTPSGFRYRLLRGLMQKKGIWDKQFGMLTPPPTEENPLSITWPGKPEDALEKLAGLFAEGLDFYEQNIAGLMAYLEEDGAWPSEFERNFV